MNRKLTKKEAIDLFRQLWTDMQTELGDCPDDTERVKFKMKWCNKNFPGKDIISCCPLCEYVMGLGPSKDCCESCPISWPKNLAGRPCCYLSDHINYYDSPISVILALPEREVPDDTNETV